MGTQSPAFHNSSPRSSGKAVNFRAPRIEVRRALTAWTRAKASLQEQMRREDFQAFVRPMYLCALLSSQSLLISLPPNNRIVERARNFRFNLEAAIRDQGYRFAGFTAYPSDEQLVLLWNHKSFGPFFRLISRKRINRLVATREQENARDQERLA